MDRKKSLLYIIPLSLILLILLTVHIMSGHVTGILMTGTEEENILYIEKYDLTIKGIDKNGTTYFCLPSYVTVSDIEQKDSGDRILLPDGSLLKDPKIGTSQDIIVQTGDDLTPWKISFLRSENLYSVFLDTGEMPMEEILHDEYSNTRVTVVSPEGRITCAEADSLIKGRGNATWKGDKKPYEIKLPHKSGLCGMTPAKKWALLANFFDPTKMYNKLAFDAASDIGMEYSIESDWVDLYANGVYLGNYLLCREPGIGEADLNINSLEKVNKLYAADAEPFEDEYVKGFYYDAPVDPETGGFLIEKNTTSYYDKKKCGFRTDHHYFTIKSPNNASRGELEYIRNFVNDIDIRLRTGSPDMLDHIDMPSFTRRFIMEEFFFNDDAFVASYYFYKKPHDEVLYAGPIWDYDGTVGWEEGPYSMYDGTILDQQVYIAAEDQEFRNPLDWDVILYENDIYREYLISVFKENIPVLRDLTDRRIDACYERIKASLIMDYAIWENGWGAGKYESTDENVAYAKEFLSKRLDFLCERWGITAEDPVAETTE